MRLVEGVGRKLLPVGPNLLEHLLVVTIRCTTCQELRLEFHQLRENLLTHRLTQCVGLASGEVSEQSREQHHLLLIDGDTVGVLQVLLHHRNIILDRLASVLSIDKVRNIIHWTRTI